MRLITTVLSLLVSLAGCDNLNTLSQTWRESDGGVDRLYSEARILEGKGTFECRASLSGQCHYAIFDEACSGAGCSAVSAQSFAVRAGEKVDRAGLPAHPRICVARTRVPTRAECERSS